MPILRFSERYRLGVAPLFAFFCRPANVVAVAPPGLDLRLEEGPEVLAAGSRFVIVVRRMGVSQRIASEVTAFDELVRIVEQQREGPFRRWALERTFAALSENEAEVVETIDYESPGGLLGLLLTPAMIEKELREAYAGRPGRVEARLGVRPASGAARSSGGTLP